MKKKLICFSMWGELPEYTVGAIQNVILAKQYFPEWICRIYYDSTVPQIIINTLKTHSNVELVFVDIPSGGKYWKDAGQFGMFWRFYAFDDDDVDVWLSRDTDSRITPYEKKEIDKFLSSENVIHSFRDNHEPKLRGGMTSFKNYLNGENTRVIDNDQISIKNLLAHINVHNTPFYADENFLNSRLYTLFQNKYSCSKRTDGSTFPDGCGQYVGNVVDAYGHELNKCDNTILVNGKRFEFQKENVEEVLKKLNMHF